MSFIYPQDSDERKKETKSFQILFPKFNAEHWDFGGKDFHDHGMDYSFEYIEDGEYKGYRILSQIKGRSKISIGESFISFPLSVKTIAYAISCASPFLLFLVYWEENQVYYLALQDYFIANKTEFDKLEKNKSTISLRIPLDNLVTEDDFDLRQIAKSTYTFNPPAELKKTR